MNRQHKIKHQEKYILKSYEADTNSYTIRRYGSKAYQFYADFRADIIYRIFDKELSEIPFAKILDVGCGTGVFIQRITRRKYTFQLYGIDGARNMLNEAKEMLETNSITADLVQASAFKLPFCNNVFDAITATRFIHQYTNDLKQNLIYEMDRCLKPGGIAIIEFYSFFPWFIRYPFKKIKSSKKYFMHCPPKKIVDRLIRYSYKTIPLMPPGSTKLERVVGLRGLKFVRSLLDKS